MNASTNGYLTKEQFLKLTTYDTELEGLGKVKFRKIGSAEFEALWPVPPAAADGWPKIVRPADPARPTAEEAEAVVASRRARREAEADWLRTLPDAEQIRWRSGANDVRFRVIAAACKLPTFTVEEARALGDDAEFLYAAILMKSGLLTPDPQPAPSAEAPTAADSVAS